ncbi:MAG: hypothetical protein WBB31_09765, partial [Saprospiraceae bacterium]
METKNSLRFFLLLILICVQVLGLKAQGVAVNADGSSPDASAMLDIKSSSKGLLIPRVSLISTTDVVTIPSPAISLLVFNTNLSITGGGGAGYYAWSGSGWVKLLVSGSTNLNYWSTGGNAGTVAGTHFIGTTDSQPLIFKVNNVIAGRVDQTTNTTILGVGSGANISSGVSNSFYGRFAGNATNSGSNNTAVGLEALDKNTTGRSNVAIGIRALRQNLTGNNLVAVGDSALYNNDSGTGFNTAVGSKAGFSTTSGNSNSFFGAASGYFNTIGDE